MANKWLATGLENRPLLLPHLLECIRQVPTPYLLTVLKLQKLIPTMTCHIHQHIATRIAPQPLAPWYILAQPICQQANEILHRHLISPVIDLDIIAIKIECAVRVIVYRAGKRVARVARHVVRQHEDDLRVGDPKPLDGAIEREHIGEMAVVEPEPRG